MIDYEFKSKLINSPMLEDYKKWSKVTYDFVYTDKDISLKQYQIVNDMASYNRLNFPKEWKECYRISQAHCHRVVRLKKRVSSMLLSGPCLFLTLTFNEKSINTLSAKVRKQYVKEFLGALKVPYVANIDFGKKNHREHYHALVQIDKIDYSLYKLGAINGQKVRNDTDDTVKLARYIAKLTNHAIKETTKRSVLMYSRIKVGDKK